MTQHRNIWQEGMKRAAVSTLALLALAGVASADILLPQEPVPATEPAASAAPAMDSLQEPYLGKPGSAQEPSARGHSTPPHDPHIITVEINKGQMLKLDRAASSIIIADPATADVQIVSPKLLFIRGKKIGQTTIYAIDSTDEPILSSVIDVTYDISHLKRTIAKVAPDADITFRTVDGGLVMDGYSNSVVESENIRSVAQAFMGADDKMVNMIKTAGSDQVMLRVKIVEMQRNDLKALGVNLQSLVSRGGMALQMLQGSDISLTDGIIARGAGNTNTNLFGQLQRGGLTLGGVIDALETQGLATVLAEPSLTTTSGKAASFLAGGQFPLPVKDQNGAITIQYKPFGVSLSFTPVVMSHNRISISVTPEVSTLNFENPIQVDGITYPILNTRQASAVVELGSGESFTLAGLLQNETSNNVRKFPVLGDLPILGALFRSQQFQNNETELVILVTPYIVRPVTEAKMQTPRDGFKPPSDAQRVIYGNLYQEEPGMMDENENPPPPPAAAPEPIKKEEAPLPEPAAVVKPEEQSNLPEPPAPAPKEEMAAVPPKEETVAEPPPVKVEPVTEEAKKEEESPPEEEVKATKKFSIPLPETPVLHGEGGFIME